MAVIALNKDSRSSELASLRNDVFELIRTKSFIRQKVKLSSGQESDYYFDMKRTMLDPVGAGLLAELIFARLPDERIDYVGGLELGAVPLISPIAMLSAFKNRPIPGLIVRKAAKEHGTKRRIEGANGPLKDKNIVVVDDVTTTGTSAMQSIRVLQDEGANVLLVISILDRDGAAAALYREAGIAFDPLFSASEFLS